MGKSSAPTPPDPKETSAAQTGTNIGTAVANNFMGMVDQVTPYGTLTYEMSGGGGGVPEITTSGGGLLGGGGVGHLFSGVEGKPARAGAGGPKSYNVGGRSFGTWEEANAYRDSLAGGSGGLNWTDPYTGQTYNIPKFTAVQTLSPEEQEKLDLSQQTQINLGNLAKDQSAFLHDYMAQPFKYGVGEHEAWASGIYDDLNRDENARMSESLMSRLANQGITAGSEAYDREMANLRESQIDSRNRFMLDAYNTGMNSALAQRNQPINEITALLSGSQVSHPNLVNTPTSKIPTTDNAALINNNYNQRLGAWQQEQAQRGSFLSGVGGLFTGFGAL